jgi:hypothetical protein
MILLHDRAERTRNNTGQIVADVFMQHLIEGDSWLVRMLGHDSLVLGGLASIPVSQ